MHMYKMHEKCVFWLTVKMTLHLLEITHILESCTHARSRKTHTKFSGAGYKGILLELGRNVIL